MAQMSIGYGNDSVHIHVQNQPSLFNDLNMTNLPMQSLNTPKKALITGITGQDGMEDPGGDQP